MMKAQLHNKLLIIILIIVTAFASVVSYQHTKNNTSVIPEIEALSVGESYLDSIWNVEVRYNSNGELSVTCSIGGKYQCPLKDPGISV